MRFYAVGSSSKGVTREECIQERWEVHFPKFLLGDRPAQKFCFYKEALPGDSHVSSWF